MSKDHLPNIALRTAIVQSGKTQKQIAKLARITEPDMSHIVRGRRVPGISERERLAKVLGRSEEDLFGVTQAVAS